MNCLTYNASLYLKQYVYPSSTRLIFGQNSYVFKKILMKLPLARWWPCWSSTRKDSWFCISDCEWARKINHCRLENKKILALTRTGQCLIQPIKNSTCPGLFYTRPAIFSLALASRRALVSQPALDKMLCDMVCYCFNNHCFMHLFCVARICAHFTNYYASLKWLFHACWNRHFHPQISSLHVYSSWQQLFEWHLNWYDLIYEYHIYVLTSHMYVFLLFFRYVNHVWQNVYVSTVFRIYILQNW